MSNDALEGLSASLEDYLEVIFHLEKSNRVARAKDIADQMNVQRASVTGALKALAGKGLINYSPYSFITLTPSGRVIAEDIIHRHETLKQFFIIALQLPPEEAEANACRMEHSINPNAVDRLVSLLEFMKICPRFGTDWFTAFARYCQKGSQTSDCEACVRDCLERIIACEKDDTH
ncbi:MAG: metal-dependent transcriptional regulator [Deltaproteobacteria bacterium]|jgi:DtxR family Mn-dependent transcriptional regulator|nr:metal-dependent transcriptional regulator [Deltaproteobacteria bacterium]